MRIIDPNDPAFRRPWVRWTVSVGPMAWGLFELWAGNPGWAFLFGVAGVYAFWKLIIQGPDQA